MPWRLFRFESETGNVGSRKGRSRKEELRSRKAEMLKWRRVGKQRKDAAGWPLLSPFFSAVVRQRNRLRQPPRRRILSDHRRILTNRRSEDRAGDERRTSSQRCTMARQPGDPREAKAVTGIR